VAAVAAAALLAALLAGCGSAPAAPAADVPVPVPEPATSTAAPAGSPAPVIPDNTCVQSYPAMSPMPAPGHMPAGSTMAAIQRRGYLIAGVDQDSYAWGYPNPSPTGFGDAYLGFDIDVLHAIAYAIFGDPDKIHFVPVTQDYRMGAANEGIVDVVADSITINCRRVHEVTFSIDYFDAAEELLVPRSDTAISVTLDSGNIPRIHGLAGGKVCTVGTTTSVQNLAELAKADGFRIVLADNWSDCVALMQQGDVQAFSTDNSILGGIAAEDPYLKLVGQGFSYEPHGIAFPMVDPYSRGDREFVSFVNGVLIGLERTTARCPEPPASTDRSCWDTLYRRWVQTGRPPAPPVPRVTPSPSFPAEG
jgi:polar amino acid transport system substrate-binding protein